MIRKLCLAAAVILATPAFGAPLAAADRIALEALAARMDRAWNEADPAANAALFAPEASARFGEEPLGEGQAAIRDQFATFFEGRPAGLRHVTNIERIESLASDLALWDAEVRVERHQDDGSWTVLTRIRNMTIAVRQPAGWRVQAVRAFPVR